MSDLKDAALRARTMDLTTLNDDDTDEKVKAVPRGWSKVGNTAAICIYLALSR